MTGPRCATCAPCSVCVLSSHSIARAEALYSTGSVTRLKSADNAIIAIPTQNSAGKVLINRIPAIITHVDHIDENCTMGTSAERIFSGA